MRNRVLVVGEFGTRNGGENSFLAVAPALMERGWQFHAAVPAESEFAQALQSQGVEITDLSLRDSGGQRKTQESIRSDMGQIIDSVKPDLIHCNSLSTSRLYGPVAHEKKVPSLGYLRDILKLSKKAIADINMLDRIIAVSNATRDWHCNQGIAANQTFVVYNGVDSDLFSPSLVSSQPGSICPVRTEFGIPVDAPVLLFVGQIGIRKGLDTLKEAFPIVASSIPDVRLLIVGKRHSQKQEAIEYEQQLKQTELTSSKSSIHWLGLRTDVPRLMRAATILVHPARQEPLGRVLLEAAATGLPIITTRVGGSAEILAGKELDSLLVSPNDSASLGTRIVELLNDTERLVRVAHTIRKVALQRFSIEACALALETHYRQLQPNS